MPDNAILKRPLGNIGVDVPILGFDTAPLGPIEQVKLPDYVEAQVWNREPLLAFRKQVQAGGAAPPHR